jgi:flagellar hook assembly protein FlgD
LGPVLFSFDEERSGPRPFSIHPVSTMVSTSPNPFTDKTHIEYFPGEAGSLIVDIYDISGNKIKTLNSASEGNGKHSVTWDGKDAAGAPVPCRHLYVCREYWEYSFPL